MSRKQHIDTLLSVMLFFLALIFLSQDDLFFEDLLIGVDDWNRYARQGLDIANNGLLINCIDGVYNGPGGFLYNYFIALHVVIFGQEMWTIQLTQILMLCISFVLIYRIFEDQFFSWQKWLWGVGLAFLLTIDFLSTYTLKLFSENVGSFFFFLSMFLWFRSGFKIGYLSTFIMAIAVLFRPNLITLVPIYFLSSNSRNLLKAWPFYFSNVLILLTLWSLIPLRNYLVSGNFVFLPEEGISDSFLQLSNFDWEYLLNKVLFCLGYLSRLMPDYRIRPHWIIIWIGFLVYIYYTFKENHIDKYRPIIWTMMTFLITNIVFVTLGSYGYRSMILLFPLVLPFGMMGVVKLFESIRKKY